MSHSTEVTFKAGLTTYSLITGSRRLAEALHIKVQQEKKFINDDAKGMVLSGMFSEYLCLTEEIVLKTMVQGHIQDLLDQQKEIQKLLDLPYETEEERRHYLRQASRMEHELFKFPVFELIVKHMD